MNMFTRKWVISVALIALSLPALAQQKPQVITVPISNPGEPVILEIGIMSARIEVIGEDRDDAAFEVSVADSQRRIITPSGTKMVSGGAFSLEIEEDDNEISFDADWRADKVTVTARIPRLANLELSTVNDGEIIIRNIEGNQKLSNVNGPITATNISGSVIAETVNADIRISFDRVDDARATSLQTINGDLHLGLPPKAGVQVQLDTAQGKIYSDFEVDVAQSEPTVLRDNDARGSAIRIESVIVARINGGGPTIRMKGLNGDIHIKKAE